MELRHAGAWYHISPWGLSWDDENYYMVGYDSETKKIKHYRVDKMLHIKVLDEEREGKEHFTVNADVYVSRQFLGWVFSLGEDIRIIGPNEVVDQMKAECDRLMRQYQSE